jgi:hypothetical protein
MAKTLYLIKHDGQGSGGFLSPPGHPSHFYSVEGYYGGWVKPVSGPDLIAGLDYLIKDEYGDVPAFVKAEATQIMESAQLRCSEAWLRTVYGYFRNSYSPDGTDRNVSHAISTSKTHCQCGKEFWNQKGLDAHCADHQTGFTAFGVTTRVSPGHGEVTLPLPPPERHLGYLCVRKFFPGHQPRLDLIRNPSATGPGYGAHDCPECGQHVQYEAREDAYAIVTVNIGRPWKYDIKCPAGRWHR